ncbi:MAG TPA: hypothetical protein VGE08_01250 [Steroidobacter sp.]
MRSTSVESSYRLHRNSKPDTIVLDLAIPYPNATVDLGQGCTAACEL